MMGKRFDANLHLKSPFDAKNLRVMGDYSGVPNASPSIKEFLAQYHEALDGKPSSIPFQ